MIKKELTKNETKEKALRLLAFRSHSEKELLEKLKRAGAKTEDLPSVVEFLKEYGLLNDAQYGARLAKDLQNIKKYGKRRIIAELKSKGISADYIDAALAEFEDEETDALLPLIERKLGGDFEKKNIDKAIRYFIYRGYRFDDIKACIEKLKQGTE